MRLLDRYVLRNFLQAYFYCAAAFFSIWLVFDISDKISTFLDERVAFSTVVAYYLTQFPEIVVTILPIALLLGLLFSLNRMSRANEIVSMLANGVSVPRLLIPLFIVGLLTAAVSGALNYSLAPHAESARKAYFEDMRADTRDPGLLGQIFRNRADNRTWFIQRFRPDRNEFTTVQVLQQDENENIVMNYLAANASYHETMHQWELKQVKLVKYDGAGNITEEQNFDSLLMPEWSETPFRLASSNMRAELLSVPELREYLHFNSDFPKPLRAPFATHLHYRFAVPLYCLIAALIAGPLAVGFSRSGQLASLALALALVFLHIFVFDHFFRALGEGDHIQPWLGAWTPNLIFAFIGLVFLYLRATNRDVRSLNPFVRQAAVAS